MVRQAEAILLHLFLDSLSAPGLLDLFCVFSSERKNPGSPEGCLFYPGWKQREITQVSVCPVSHSSCLRFLAQACGFQLLCAVQQLHYNALASFHVSTQAIWARLTAALRFGKTSSDSPKMGGHGKLVRNDFKVISYPPLTCWVVSGSPCHSAANKVGGFVLHHS